MDKYYKEPDIKCPQCDYDFKNESIVYILNKGFVMCPSCDKRFKPEFKSLDKPQGCMKCGDFGTFKQFEICDKCKSEENGL
ncbi:MAG TPA: hypothetical protein DCP90_05570 [Clostridiales bacterium]|nr:hypothetical protein [Clostridiales bacterium]